MTPEEQEKIARAGQWSPGGKEPEAVTPAELLARLRRGEKELHKIALKAAAEPSVFDRDDAVPMPPPAATLADFEEAWRTHPGDPIERLKLIEAARHAREGACTCSDPECPRRAPR